MHTTSPPATQPSPTATALHWNWPHALLLLMLVPYAWGCRQAGWPDAAMLSLGTLASLAWLMWAKRRWPARTAWTPGRPELLRDGAFLGLNALTDALGGLLLTWLAGALAPWRLALPGAWATSGVGTATQLVAAVLLGELGPYLLHRWAHRGGWGWQVHRLHHAPERVNASNNVTTHPVNVLWNQLSRTLPWLLLGLSPQVMAWAALFIQVQSFAVHANISGTLGPLNRLLGSAELHRWHHSMDEREALNYGTAVPLWDQLFGTWHPPAVIGPAQVGVRGLTGAPRWANWRRLLAAPFCPRCR